jgi:hypothetical protein
MIAPNSKETLIVSFVITLILIAISFWIERKQGKEDNMEDWVYTDLEPVELPEDQQEIEWVDYRGTLREGVYEAHGRKFYASPNEWNYVSDVQKWRPVIWM